MIRSRYGHTATVLRDGRVLVTGGFDRRGRLEIAAEVYDPGTGSWTPTSDMSNRRAFATATLLDDDRVLVAGGLEPVRFAPEPRGTNHTDLFDPSRGRFTQGNNMDRKRYGHTATLLDDGDLLVVGGNGRRVGRFDPATGRWVDWSPMARRRAFHTATTLPGGSLLAAGGSGGPGDSRALCELYDDSTGWTDTATMNRGRKWHTATLLDDGRVLAVGGQDRKGRYVRPAELYG